MPFEKMMKLILTSLSLAVLSGCADGSALVVGETRPAIEDWESVEVVLEMPEGAEQIAVVKASSSAGFNQQRKLDYAVEELKKQAANVGANTVVLGSRSTSTEVVGMPTGENGGTMITTDDAEVVQGIAVYVQR